MPVTNDSLFIILIELINQRHEVKLKLWSSSNPQMVINQGFKEIN